MATRTEALKPSDLARVVVDTTVQPKAVMFPTDAKPLNRARERLVRLANKLGVELRQSYRCVGKLALIKHQRYAHAHQFKRANRSLRKLKTYLGRVIRDIGRRIASSNVVPLVEPVIGHLKGDHCMGRNYLTHSSGDAINAVLAAVGYNFQPPHLMAEAFDAQNPDRRQVRCSAQISLNWRSSRVTNYVNQSGEDD